MKIYPKVSNAEMSKEMEEVIKNSEGIEIQFFDENGITSEFNFWDVIIEFKNKYPNLKEITVHPPLADYNFEMLVLKNVEIIKNQLRKLVDLSEQLDMNLNMLYHNYMTPKQYISTGLMNVIRDLISIIDGTRVTMLLENLYMMIDEKVGCSVLEICKYIDHPNFRVCIDTTHVHCKANIYKIDFEEMLVNDFNREDCGKYVKQIHFASALNGDGYIDKKTHGRKHESYKSLVEEYEWLKQYGMGEKNFITEVSEEDYFTRVDQLEEIKMLKKAMD